MIFKYTPETQQTESYLQVFFIKIIITIIIIIITYYRYFI